MNGVPTIFGLVRALMAEREGIEPTKDHNSPSTVLKTDAINVFTMIVNLVATL